MSADEWMERPVVHSISIIMEARPDISSTKIRARQMLHISHLLYVGFMATVQVLDSFAKTSVDLAL